MDTKHKPRLNKQKNSFERGGGGAFDLGGLLTAYGISPVWPGWPGGAIGLSPYVPYLGASAVVIHYEEALYQVYAPLPSFHVSLLTLTLTIDAFLDLT